MAKQFHVDAANAAGEDRNAHPLRRIACATEDVEIYRGRFSWVSAFFMCVFVLCGFASLIMMMLSLRDTTFNMVATEVSYIDCQNPPGPMPPWDFVPQPNGATSRKIGERFSFAMPQVTLYYSLFSGSFGLFTVAYFCSELLIQDLGIFRVRMMGEVINQGVDMFILRTVPAVMGLVLVAASVIYFISGMAFTISMVIGAVSALVCANLGTNMNFEGGPRLTHALNYGLSDSLNMAIRTGAIGGLAAHAMAQMGIVIVWMVVREAPALLGFGAGCSIVAFYNRVGGGLFAKGSDIGSDFVSVMIGEDVDDFKMDHFGELRKSLADKDGDGEVDADYLQKQSIFDPNAYVQEEEVGFITEDEMKIRLKIEEEMENTIKTMHPVNYLDAIGENIADVGGTSSDLMETMVVALAVAINFGSRAHEVPSFGTSLPFNIISTGTLCCSAVSYHVWCHEKHTSTRIRHSLRLNLFIVMFVVLCVASAMNYMQWKVYHTISFSRMINYDIIIFLGLISPEACAYICEFFTSINCAPVRWLATNAHLGIIQVILQGLGQGFVSAGVPSVVNIFVQIVAYYLEGFYGLVLLACASLACTGWQATISAYGAVANNSNQMVHLTTVNEVAHHRANVCAVVGTTTSHNGKCVAGQNAFFTTTALIAALMAEKYTKLGKNFQSTVGQELSQWSRAGLLAGIIMTMLFLANVMTSCIKLASRLVNFCKDNKQVEPRLDKEFPATHIQPLKTLVAFTAVLSFQLTLSPLLQTFCAPLVVGNLFGFKGLLMLVSGGNSVCFSLNMFLINSGQAWDATRKYVLFGMLRNEAGEQIGAESDLYEWLGIGEQIGGPMEDLCGPALNNFIKLVSVVSFMTLDQYDEFPENTWVRGVVQVIGNFAMVSFLKFGLQKAIDCADQMVQGRNEAIEFEEGTTLLREIQAREKALTDKLAEMGLKKDADDIPLF